MTDLKGDLAALRLPSEAARPRRGRRLLTGVVVIAVLVAAIGALRMRARLAEPVVETFAPLALRSEDVPRTAPVVTASGYVVARRKAVVSSKVQGRLAELRVEEGSRVRSGDVIARLESQDLEASIKRSEAAVAKAETDLAEARRQLGIAERLYASERVVSQDYVDGIRAHVLSGQAVLAQAQAELVYGRALLDNTIIRAPFSGTVVKKMAEVGESVAPIPPGVNISTSSGAIVALADLETLEVEADVNESNVARLVADQPAEVVVEAFPETKYRAALRQVIPSADRTKATVMTKVTILDKDGRLRPEMSARVTFLADVAPPPAGAALFGVPGDALVASDGKQVLLAVENGTLRAVPVVLGPARDGRATITGGLAGNEQLVRHPLETMKPGDRVKAQKP